MVDAEMNKPERDEFWTLFRIYYEAKNGVVEIRDITKLVSKRNLGKLRTWRKHTQSMTRSEVESNGSIIF